ncbi:MAG TPA: PAC2 family protein [Anaerolineales bacterium]|nr:PAC2 family protein [Anaerolineales bacterium]
MSEAVEIWEKPEAEEIYMLAGWRQWADAGSTSSGLPQYLIKRLQARQIGRIKPGGFYLFQIPGTHDLVRPVVKFDAGLPLSLQTSENEIHYAEDRGRGWVIFLGDEPHLNVEAYVAAFLHIAEALNVRRIISFGGVYGELPYDKERLISSSFSLPRLKPEIERLAVNLTEYHGGASIGSVICKRAGEQDREFVSLYAFVPAYEFSSGVQLGNSIRIENDYLAWLGILRRMNYMLKTELDTADLEKKSKKLMRAVDAKVDELETSAPQMGVREYLRKLSDEFTEVVFNPLDDVWEEELRRLYEKFDSDE